MYIKLQARFSVLTNLKLLLCEENIKPVWIVYFVIFVWRYWFSSNDLLIYFIEDPRNACYNVFIDIYKKKINGACGCSRREIFFTGGGVFFSHEYVLFKKKKPLKVFARCKMLIPP